MTPRIRPTQNADRPYSLEHAIIEAGGAPRSAAAGATAYRWQGSPQAFVFVTSGRLSIQFRTAGRQVPWAECRAASGQDCMPVTAAILSQRTIAVRAVCMAPSAWLELSPTALSLLVHQRPAFRHALFAGHVARLPSFFARISTKNALGIEQRVADWLLCHARQNIVHATHADIAGDLLTAREVVSRKMQGFAAKGWIAQHRGCIEIEAPAALARAARGVFSIFPDMRASV